MRTAYRKIFPTAYEFWYLALATVALVLVGNGKVILEHYNLIASSNILRNEFSDSVGSGLHLLDNFQATPGLVTFVTWGLVGLIVLGIVQSFVRASGLIAFERDLSSNQYIHPQNFSRHRYWERIIIDSIVSFLLLFLLVIGAGLYVVFLVPFSFGLVQTNVLHASLMHFVGMSLGMVAIFVGTTLLYMLLKLVVWHRHISRQ